ncbi:MAG: Bug family tripartite tricarboxylate transporter substrate binding protein [Burkholderiales bacterium]
MTPSRRSLLASAAALAGGTLPLPRAARAQDAPLRILVGFPPGGATDVLARMLGDRLRETLGQNVMVENRPGAGGMIATQALKGAPADGTTVMLTIDHTHVIVPLTFKAPGYDPARDFTPLAGVASYYNVLAVASSLNVKTLAEFGTWLKANPQQANFGVPAPGSVPQFAGLLVGKALGTRMTPVPYKGGAPLVQDLLGGQVPAAVLSLTETIEHHRAGRMRVLAVSGTKRAASAPDIPTYEEQGIKGLDKNPWTGFFGPRGLPAAFVERFTRAVQTILGDPAMLSRLATMGNVADYAAPPALQEWVTSATAHWGPVIRESGWELQ